MKVWLLQEWAGGEEISPIRVFQARSDAIETGERIVRENYGPVTTETLHSGIGGEDSYRIHDEDNPDYEVSVFAAPLE